MYIYCKYIVNKSSFFYDILNKKLLIELLLVDACDSLSIYV